MPQSVDRRLVITRALLAFIVSFLVVQAPGRAQGIVGLPAEVAGQLPGVVEIFTRDTSIPPEILPGEDFVPGELVVRFNIDLSDEHIETEALNAGATSVERISPIGLFRVLGTPTIPATESLMMALWEAQVAVTIEPNYTGGGVAFVPNDPHHLNGNQWHLEEPLDVDLDLEDAWDITRGSSEIVVAVIDAGMDITHPEFQGRVYVNPGEIPGNDLDDDGNGYVDDVSGWNAVSANENVGNMSGNHHGTSVASIIMASSDNSHQVAGIDHFARVLPIKALEGRFGNYDVLVAALDYLIINPGIADVVNISLANYTPLSGLRDALYAVSRSSIVIGASGNNGTPTGADLKYPESHPAVLTVSGTDRFDNRASFSSSGHSVEFSAPAVDVASASGEFPDNPLAVFIGDGTSFAAPMVSGIASLCLAIHPAMDRADLEFALAETAVDLGLPGCDTDFGCGRVNAHGALFVMQTLVFIDGFETGDVSEWDPSDP